jgi:hypothetical protein
VGDALSWYRGAPSVTGTPGRNARAHTKYTSAFGAEMCGVGRSEMVMAS